MGVVEEWYPKRTILKAPALINTLCSSSEEEKNTKRMICMQTRMLYKHRDHPLNSLFSEHAILDYSFRKLDSLADCTDLSWELERANNRPPASGGRFSCDTTKESPQTAKKDKVKRKNDTTGRATRLTGFFSGGCVLFQQNRTRVLNRTWLERTTHATITYTDGCTHWRTNRSHTWCECRRALSDPPLIPQIFYSHLKDLDTAHRNLLQTHSI